MQNDLLSHNFCIKSRFKHIQLIFISFPFNPFDIYAKIIFHESLIYVKEEGLVVIHSSKNYILVCNFFH